MPSGVVLSSLPAELSPVEAAACSAGIAGHADWMECSMTQPSTRLLADTYRYTCTHSAGRAYQCDFDQLIW